MQTGEEATAKKQEIAANTELAAVAETGSQGAFQQVRQEAPAVAAQPGERGIALPVAFSSAVCSTSAALDPVLSSLCWPSGFAALLSC